MSIPSVITAKVVTFITFDVYFALNELKPITNSRVAVTIGDESWFLGAHSNVIQFPEIFNEKWFEIFLRKREDEEK